MEPLRLETITDPARLPGLEKAWTRLHAQAAPDNPFASFHWQQAWLHGFDAGDALRLLLVWEGDLLRGLAPLLRQGPRLGGLMVAWRFFFNYYSDFPCILLDPQSPEALPVLLGGMRGALGWRGVLAWRFARADGPDLAAFRRQAAAAGLAFLERPGPPAPWIPLEGRFEAYLKTVRGLKSMRRYHRKLERMGEAVFEVRRYPEEVDAAFEDLLAVSAATWKADIGEAIASQPKLAAFLRQIARDHARLGLWRCYFLKLDGRPIAFDFSLIGGGVLYSLKVGYDPAYSRFSPGNWLLLRSLETAFADPALREMNLLGEFNHGKADWTDRSRPRANLLIWPRRSPVGLLVRGLAAARRLAKGALSRLGLKKSDLKRLWGA